MNLSKIYKFIEYFVDAAEWVKARVADFRMKKANEEAKDGDQRDEEKLINSTEPGRTRFKYLGLFERDRKKKPD